ncbi:histidine kinase dimerization/phospho-acceptor domain-containing protein [Streptomyces sp. NPDC028722]|uniref:histidine kinase dimerization/phospho-acceptor domain-containing protein n=1 Tax=Streptomyces sp. NPDC028722 TaxID=3155016 RepID=UPI0033DE2602
MERGLVADLSHRLRTPLTALHLESERLSTLLPTPEAERLDGAISYLESELSSIIKNGARPPPSYRPAPPSGLNWLANRTVNVP